MKHGVHFRIPETPTDVELIWRAAKPFEPSQLPDWLSPEDARDYRYVGRSSSAGLAGRQRRCFLAELEELELTGAIIERDARDASIHHVYVPAPLKYDLWSIGIYVGSSPAAFWRPENVFNPVLTRERVSDVSAVFVADPFMVPSDNTWYMFFEVMNWRSDKGEIGLATSKDALSWNYQRIVLAEDFHMSYPYVFDWMGDYYMIPETCAVRSIRLYKALDFPMRWGNVCDMVRGRHFSDPSIVRFADRWWLFTETSAAEKHDTLRLYYADDLRGPWLEHPRSPIVRGNPRIARPAGRVLLTNRAMIRYAQNCHPAYGTDVRALEVTELTTTAYSERELGGNPVLEPGGAGWNASGMHHIDAHPTQTGGWIACVDGWISASQHLETAEGSDA